MSIKDIILDAYSERTSVDRKDALNNMNTFSKQVSGVESSYGTNLINPDSSARGIYQFLTKGTGNAFQTGLNRTMNAYKDAGKKVPAWVERARKHNDPIKLTDGQQEEVMLANIYKQKTSNLTGMLEGNNNASMDLYRRHHHTDLEHTATADRAAEFFRPSVMVETEQGLIQKPYGLGDIWDTITSPFDSGAVDAFQGNYTVKPNDNMYQIARRNGMTLEDLVAINPEIKNPSIIHVGQNINLGNGWFESL
jgi:hypothetical protein